MEFVTVGAEARPVSVPGRGHARNPQCAVRSIGP